MAKEPSKKPAAKLESDPRLYRVDSVMGNITCGGKPLAGATVTVVKSKAVVVAGAGGDYIVELDPKKLGSRHHELVFAAPGCASVTREVVLPDKQQLRIDVELKASSK